MAASVVIVRHGTTVLNRKATHGESAERIRGWLDVPLDEHGMAEATKIAKDVSDEHPVERVYSSTLRRAEQTARQVGLYCCAPVVPSPALRPWNVGSWAGQLAADVHKDMLEHVANPDKPAPGGEPFARFARRYLSYLQVMLDEAKRHERCVAAVTHTRNVQLTKAWVAAGSKPDLSYDCGVMNDYSNEMAPGQSLVLRFP